MARKYLTLRCISFAEQGLEGRFVTVPAIEIRTNYITTTPYLALLGIRRKDTIRRSILVRTLHPKGHYTLEPFVVYCTYDPDEEWYNTSLENLSPSVYWPGEVVVFRGGKGGNG